MLKQWILLAVAFFLGVFGAFFLLAFAYLIATDPADNLTLIAPGLMTSQSGERLVTGSLRNNTDTHYRRVLAELWFIDEDGEVVEDTFTTITDLEPGETWHFEVPVHAKEVVRAVIDGQCGRSYAFREEVAAEMR